MGISCPLQNAQPLGGKFQLMILTSPRNGSDILCSSRVSSLRWKNSKKRQNEVNDQKRHHVGVGLRASARSKGNGSHGQGWGGRRELTQRGLRPYPACRAR